jgi:cytochrome P450
MQARTGDVEAPNLFSPENLADPYPIYAWLRENAPVQWNQGIQAWTVVRYQDVVDNYLDKRLSHHLPYTVTSPPTTPEEAAADERIGEWIRKWVLLKDPPDHTRMRSVLNKAFTVRIVQSRREQFIRRVDGWLDDAEAKGGLEVMHDVAIPMTFNAVCDLLGMPEDQRDLFYEHSLVIANYWNGEHPNRAETEAVIAESTDMLAALLEARRSAPQDDLLTALVQAEDEGRFLSDDEIISNLHLLLFVGYETTECQIGNSLVALLKHPDQLELLRQKPDLMRSAIDEFIRYDPSAAWAHIQVIAEDFELYGHELHAGERLAFGLAAGHRDPNAFSNPDRLDITRNPEKNLSFGMGPHYCIGAALARLEVSVALERMLSRYPVIKLAGDVDARPNAFIRGPATLPVDVGLG